ncbi:hypothetical protein BD626DRAFT_472308, partial [Schizophyllum amplum]
MIRRPRVSTTAPQRTYASDLCRRIGGFMGGTQCIDWAGREAVLTARAMNN